MLSAAAASFEDVNKTLGIFLRDPEEWFKEGRLADSKVMFSVERIEELIHLRNEAGRARIGPRPTGYARSLTTAGWSFLTGPTARCGSRSRSMCEEALVSLIHMQNR